MLLISVVKGDMV